MSVYLFFYHGRHTADEELDDWGFNGPVLGPFARVAITYGCHIKAFDEREKCTDFSVDTGGLVEVLGAFYGDFLIIDEKTCKKDYYETKKKTKEVLAKDISLLIGKKEEWIKVYVERSLRNGSHTEQPRSPDRTGKRRPGRESGKGTQRRLPAR